MLVAVKSCESHWGRCAAIRDTWWTPIVHFFTGNPLDVPDDYAHLPQKTHAICRWALKRGHLWVFFCDTDTYVSVPRLVKAIGPDYTGYRLEDKGYASGGAGYLLSQLAMRAVAQSDPDGHQFEDEFVGSALARAAIPLVHDPRFSLYDEVLPTNEVISRHLSSREKYEVSMMHEAHRKATEAAASA